MNIKDKYSMDWLSAHIFFKGEIYSYACDKIILEVIKPFIELCSSNKWIEKYFFIRYSELGSHIRLRMFGEQNILRNNVRPELGHFIEGNFPEELIEYPYKKENPRERQEEREKNNFLWIPYEPEIDRYGGEKAIHTAEKFFHCSSVYTIKLLGNIANDDNSSRLGKGLITMVIILHTFLPNIKDAKLFIDSYSNSYLQSRIKTEPELKAWKESYNSGFDKQSAKLIKYVSTLWDALSMGYELELVFNEFRNSLEIIRTEFWNLFNSDMVIKNSQVLNNWNIAVRYIISSYLHMSNNRLGISIVEESYLASLIKNSFVKSKIEIPST